MQYRQFRMPVVLRTSPKPHKSLSQVSLYSSSSSGITLEGYMKNGYSNSWKGSYLSDALASVTPTISLFHPAATTNVPALVPFDFKNLNIPKTTSLLYTNLTPADLHVLTSSGYDGSRYQRNASASLPLNSEQLFINDNNLSLQFRNSTENEVYNFSLYEDAGNWTSTEGNFTSSVDPVATIVTAAILALMILATVIGEYGIYYE